VSFTPGPWKHETHDEEGFFRFYDIVTESGRILGTIDDDDDARLIAAAPELLEACEEALGNDVACECENASNMYPSLRQKLQAAIRKARGEA
jgi:hypothetical protein